MRILLLAGGSGGHISPALAVAAKLREKCPSAEIYFFTSRSPLDASIFEKSGETYTRIFSGKWRRYFSWKNIVDPLFLLLGFFQSLVLMMLRRPNVIFSKGGFSALPPVLAAAVLRIPIIAHESDATPGIANRVTQRFAKILLTAFPQEKKERCSLYVGTPLRPEIGKANGERAKSICAFSDNKKPIVFGFGGSQGAKILNDMCIRVAEKLGRHANIVWITGPKNYVSFSEEIAKRGTLGAIQKEGEKGSKRFRFPEGMRGHIGGEKENAEKKTGEICFFPYVHQGIFDYIAAADVVVSRAGGAIFELAALNKAMLLIPLASAAGNHQEKNARVFERHGAAKVLLEKEINEETFFRSIMELLENEEMRKEMQKNAKKMARTDAAEKIAEIILKSF